MLAPAVATAQEPLTPLTMTPLPRLASADVVHHGGEGAGVQRFE